MSHQIQTIRPDGSVGLDNVNGNILLNIEDHVRRLENTIERSRGALEEKLNALEDRLHRRILNSSLESITADGDYPRETNDGWRYVKNSNNTATKINWYILHNLGILRNYFTLSDIVTVWFVVDMNIDGTSFGNGNPFINVLTIPRGDNDDNASWHRTNIDFTTSLTEGKYVLYMGRDPRGEGFKFPSDITFIPLTGGFSLANVPDNKNNPSLNNITITGESKSSNATYSMESISNVDQTTVNEAFRDEEILFMPFSTASNSIDVDLRLRGLGIKYIKDETPHVHRVNMGLIQ